MPELDALDSAVAELGQLGEEPPHLAAEGKMLQARFRTRAIVHISFNSTKTRGSGLNCGSPPRTSSSSMRPKLIA